MAAFVREFVFAFFATWSFSQHGLFRNMVFFATWSFSQHGLFRNMVFFATWSMAISGGCTCVIDLSVYYYTSLEGHTGSFEAL
jgi:hypothetical protein